MTDAELGSLTVQQTALDEIAIGIGEARELIGDLPSTVDPSESMSVIQRTASRALLKSVEQMQDALARTLRLVLTLEREDLTGFSARAIGDRAETLGLIDDGDEWSALARLRNRLVHAYPLVPAARLAHLHDAWAAAGSLLDTHRHVASYIAANRSRYR